MAGRALVGWIKPNLRAGLERAVADIESEAGRDALRAVRERIATLDPTPADALRCIDEALELERDR
jgi:hypothetical protein